MFLYLDVNPRKKEEDEQKRLRILDSFRNGPFEDIIARNEHKVHNIFSYNMSIINE